MPPSKAKQALVAKRRSEMLIMKIQGRTAAQIAEHYGISRATARSDLSRAIKKAREIEVHDAELYRFVQGARLEQLLRGVWDEAADGDLKAGEQARKYISDLTDLFGLKVPVRTEISGPDGGVIQFGGRDETELAALIGIAGQENADVPALDHASEDQDEEESADDETSDDDG